MRAPFQVIVFPYRFCNDNLEVLIGKRSDGDYWQAISGGGEYSEAPLETAKRELLEESSLTGGNWYQLDSLCTLPKCHYRDHEQWGDDIFVIPEYAFMTQSSGSVKVSDEHTALEWMSVKKADSLLKYDSNRNALWELCQRVSLPSTASVTGQE